MCVRLCVCVCVFRVLTKDYVGFFFVLKQAKIIPIADQSVVGDPPPPWTEDMLHRAFSLALLWLSYHLQMMDAFKLRQAFGHTQTHTHL